LVNFSKEQIQVCRYIELKTTFRRGHDKNIENQIHCGQYLVIMQH